MLTIISPAKNLEEDAPLPKIRGTQPQMLDQAEVLVEQLRQMPPQGLSTLMGISDKLGTLNFDRYQRWSRPFNSKNARPAVLTFNGDVYQGLAADTFNQDDFKFAQEHLRILSGLYGILRPLDLMQAYRLEMGTKLKNPKGAHLYAYWKDSITPALNKQLKKIGSDTVVHLASNEYFKSIDKKALDANIIEPVFKDWKNGQYKTISFFAKKARGLMSAYSIKKRLTNPEALKDFDGEGYGYNDAMSTDKKWVFIRKAP